jgi:D-threo-aldose 1-dehydrogenase
MLRETMQWPGLGLGCASLGAPELTDRQAEAVIVAAIESGIRFFDVAPLYGGGLAELRLGRVLRDLARETFVLCTKTGVTRPFGQPATPAGASRRRAADVWNYSPRATRASVEQSLARLNVDRLDVVHLHDVDEHQDECLQAYRALAELREEGLIDKIGIGSNLVAPVQNLLSRAQFDAFLLAGCYTLLAQDGAALLDDAKRSGVKAIAGGVFNSGILATWPQREPTYGYEAADPGVIARTARIAAICQRYDVPIAAAALQFVAAHTGVSTVLIGPRSVAELELNVAAMTHRVPDVLWTDLEASSLIPAGGPRPVDASLRPTAAA